VNTFLLVCSAISLLAVAAVASALFFQSFVPDRVLSTPVHLQYGSGLNPWGLVSLVDPAMKSQQDYDVSVTLAMPKSTSNTERGNFMIAIHLLDSPVDRTLDDDAAVFASTHESFGVARNVLFRSRRPALVPYVDPIVSLTSRVMFLFWHMVFPSANTITLNVPLAERVTFPRLTGPPKAAYVEVEAGQTIQIYSAELTLTAQLSGLRYIMFHYRLPAYITFTLLFWIFEVVFMGGAFLLFGPLRSANSTRDEDPASRPTSKGSKLEGPVETSEYSDHPHTFPTTGRQAHLKYEPDIKKEEVDDETERLLSELPTAGAEADDEDDDIDPPSYASGAHSDVASVKKRSSRSFRD